MDTTMKLNVPGEIRKDEKTASRERTVRALTALKPVYCFWAQYAPEEAYGKKAAEGNYWAGMEATAEYAAACEALSAYLPYYILGNKNAAHIGFITSKDHSISAQDLASGCLADAIGKLPKHMRNVCDRYTARKGVVDGGEGCLLYLERSATNLLVDIARRIDPGYGRNTSGAEEARDFFGEGVTLQDADQLQLGEMVIAKNNRVGRFAGETSANGSRYGIFCFKDGCTEHMLWSLIPGRVRLFKGNEQEIPQNPPKVEEKSCLRTTISLNAPLGDEEDEDGMALINALAAVKSAEEDVLLNEQARIVRATYQSTLRNYLEEGDYIRALMLVNFVNDTFCESLTHVEEILQRIREEGGLMEVLSGIHAVNCLILNLDMTAPGTGSAPEARDYTKKELTLAKYQAKKRLGMNMAQALAA